MGQLHELSRAFHSSSLKGSAPAVSPHSFHLCAAAVSAIKLDGSSGFLSVKLPHFVNCDPARGGGAVSETYSRWRQSQAGDRLPRDQPIVFPAAWTMITQSGSASSWKVRNEHRKMRGVCWQKHVWQGPRKSWDFFFFPSNEGGCRNHRIKLRTIYPKPVYATGVLWGAPMFEGWGAGSYEQLFAAAQWQDRSLQWPGWGASGDDHHPPSSWPQHTHNFVTQTQLSVLCCLASPLTTLFPWSRVRYRIAVAWNRWPGRSGGQRTEQEVWHQETSSEPFLALSLT